MNDLVVQDQERVEKGERFWRGKEKGEEEE